jgi:hypothetical protein
LKPAVPNAEIPLPARSDYLGFVAVTIEAIGVVTFLSAFFFFFSLFLGLLSPMFNTPNQLLTQLYPIPVIIAISSKTKIIMLVMPTGECGNLRTAQFPPPVCSVHKSLLFLKIDC